MADNEGDSLLGRAHGPKGLCLGWTTFDGQ